MCVAIKDMTLISSPHPQYLVSCPKVMRGWYVSGPGAHYCGSAHSAQLLAPMTSDHWLPVLELSPAPSPTPAHHQWLLSTSIMTRERRLLTCSNWGSSLALATQRSVMWSNLCGLYKIFNWPSLALIIALHYVSDGQSGHVYKMPIL